MAVLETSAEPWFAALSRRLSTRAVPDGIDFAVAGACFAAFTVPVLAGWARGAGSPLAVAGLGLLAAAPLTVRRRWPVLSLAAVTVVYLGAAAAGVRFTPFVSNAGPNFAIAVFTAADRRDRRSSIAAAAAASLATWGVYLLGREFHPGQGQDAVQALAAIPAWIAGDIVRTRRRYRDDLAVQSHRETEERERRVRAEERLRLSRDVHDVLSHSLSMIAVRSGVARLLLDEQPAEAREALAAIETASRSALGELRQILRQVRDPGDEPIAPVLADLPALADRMRASGLNLSYRCPGGSVRYSAALEHSAYRIAQEALTNVVKHAGATTVQLEVRSGPSELVISVTDDGPGPFRATAPGGLGITGMRERARMLDGELTAGPGPDGGFQVVARLPATGTRP